MIIVRLIGGLGNQLFQYALGRHLCEIYKTVLKIDVSGFKSYKLHKYSLWAFNIQENYASTEEVETLTTPKKRTVDQILDRIFHKKPRRAKTHIREKKLFSFDPKVLKLSDGVYLDGYWQSEKYFADIAGIIRHEVTVKSPQVGRNKELAEMIASNNSVSLHIRRRDYVSNPKTNQVHGSCDLDYYFRCVEHLSHMVKNPNFFIFSDDPEWARQNLKLPYPTVLVEHNGEDKNYEDLRLMSQCRHHILANSSFSWWGAWLNPKEDKLVFAPRRWIAKKKVNFKDIIPAQWTKK